MSSKATDFLAAAMLAAAKAGLDGGFFYGFAGPTPADAADPLDMGASHTQLFKLSLNGGVTGLTFETPTGLMLVKTASEVWSGLVAFDGAEDAETELAPDFFRFCPAGDDGRGVATGERLQGTLGGPSSGADVELGTNTVVANGTNTQAIDSFSFNLSALG